MSIRKVNMKMYIGKKAKLIKPFIDIDMSSFEPYYITEGDIFHEYIYSEFPESSCVLVAFPKGGFKAFKLDQVVIEN